MNNQIGSKINDKNYIPLPPFKGFILENFPFIEANFDAITNYELLCKVIEELNKVIYNQNEVQELGTELVNYYNALVDALNEAINEFESDITGDFNDLKNYVDNYFDNNFPQLVSNKLDEMAEDGTLENLLNDAVHLIKVYNSLSDLLEESSSMVDGLTVKTLGYHALNDGGSAFYKIRTKTESDIPDGGLLVAVGDSLVAELQYDSVIYAKQYGCYGDNTHDDTTTLQKAIQGAENTVGILCINNGQYKLTDDLILNKAIKITGEYERGLTGDSLVYGTQLNQTTSDTNIFTLNTANSFYGLEISHMRLNGSGGTAINLESTVAFSEFIIEKIHINGGFNIGMYVKGSIGRISDCDIAMCNTGIKATIVNVTISHNNFWNNNNCDIQYAGVSRDSVVVNNWFEKNVQTGCNILFQAPSNVQRGVIEKNSFQSTAVPSIIFDGITNINDVMRFMDLVIRDCRFNATNTHPIKVDMKNDQNVQNSNASNSSMIRFENCEFDTVSSYAIETDYATLYWGLINCVAYSNYGYGTATLKDESFTSQITYSDVNRYFRTNACLRFSPLINSSYSSQNALYLEASSNLLAFKDNDNTVRYFQYIRQGSSSNRPASPKLGTCYFDTTLNKPIWYNQNTQWVDATGTVVS